MTPECCKNCPNNETTTCNYAQCPKWRSWFRKEWALIRKAAERIKTGADAKPQRAKIRIARASTLADFEKKERHE